MPDKAAVILAELTTKWLGLHPEHRDTIRLLGELLVELARTDSAAVPTDSQPPSQPVPAASPTPQNISVPYVLAHPIPAAVVPGATIRPAEIRGPRAVVPLRIGDTIRHVEVQGGGEAALGAMASAADRPPSVSYDSMYVPPELPDLEALALRCEHAARAARFAAETAPALRTPLWRVQADEYVQRALSLGAPRGPWSFDADEHFDPVNLQRLAACFDNLAHASRVVTLSRKEVEGSRIVEPRSLEEREVIRLLAESQSSLRIAGEPFGQTRDEDQYTAFRWLRLVTEHERIYLDRFMRMDDPGDPDLAGDLARRIAELEQTLAKRKESRTDHKSKRTKARYHAKRILSDIATGDEADWNSMTAAIKHMLSRGESVASMNALLNDVRESPRDGAPLELVDALSTTEPEEDASSASREYGPNVQRVRDWLSGTRVVIIGGERRNDAAERITAAFDLGELEWVSLVEHSSSAPIQPEVIRADTKLVLVLIKLAGHTHVDDARRWSREAGKPCVLLRAGYNPEQIAASVIDQASESIPEHRAVS